MDDFRDPSHFRKCPYRMLLYTVLGAAYPNLWGYLMFFFFPPLTSINCIPTSPSTRWMWYTSAKSGASILAWDMSEMDINGWVCIGSLDLVDLTLGKHQPYVPSWTCCNSGGSICARCYFFKLLRSQRGMFFLSQSAQVFLQSTLW